MERAPCKEVPIEQYLWSSSGALADRRDMMVDFPVPCRPMTPTTNMSVWSLRYCNTGQHNMSVWLSVPEPDRCVAVGKKVAVEGVKRWVRISPENVCVEGLRSTFLVIF